MEKNKTKINLFEDFKIYLIVILILSILVFILKFYNLTTKNSTPEDWVTFLNYLGGTINPFIAIFNLIFFVKLTLAIQKSTENNSWVEKSESLTFSLIESLSELSSFIIQTGYDIDKLNTEYEKLEYTKINQKKIVENVTKFNETIFIKRNLLRIYIDSGIFIDCQSREEFLSSPGKVIDRMNEYLNLFDGKTTDQNKSIKIKNKYNEFEDELKKLLNLGKKFSDEIYKI